MPPPPLEWQPEQLNCPNSTLAGVHGFGIVVVRRRARIDRDEAVVDARDRAPNR